MRSQTNLLIVSDQLAIHIIIIIVVVVVIVIYTLSSNDPDG